MGQQNVSVQGRKGTGSASFLIRCAKVYQKSDGEGEDGRLIEYGPSVTLWKELQKTIDSIR